MGYAQCGYVLLVSAAESHCKVPTDVVVIVFIP
jgi:hypothetical protein